MAPNHIWNLIVVPRERDKWKYLQAHIMEMRGQCPREEDKRILQLLLNLYRRAVLQTRRKQKRGQEKMESIMDMSNHTEKILEYCIINTLGQ